MGEMRYSYEKEKAAIFTEKGLKDYTCLRDKVFKALNESGAIMMGHAMSMGPRSGTSWYMMALVDHMAASGDLREVSEPGCAGQHRVFVRPTHD